MSTPQRKRSLPSSPGRENIPRPHGKHKRGKRIVQLLQQQQDDLQQQQQHQEQGQEVQHPPQPPPHQYEQRPSSRDKPPLMSRTRTVSDAASVVKAPQVVLTANASRACLLGVPGLTREALDDCIDTFFTTIEPAYRLSQPRDVFLDRVRVLLYDTAGADIPNDIVDVQGASELLVLAVACLGAPLSAHHTVGQALYDHCRALTQERDYLEDNVLDIIEAVNLLESAVPSQPTQGQDQPTFTPLKLDALGKGFAIDLAMYHKLNLPSALGEKDPEKERRETLFWRLWELDAIRMASARLPCRLAEVNIGWAFPCSASQDPHQSLARVARQICSSMLSVRVKTVGIREADLWAAISALDALDTDSSDPGSVSCEQLFLSSTRNLLYLVCWVAAKDNQMAPHVIASVEAATMRATERMALLAQAVTKHNLLKSVPRAVRDDLAAFILFLVRKLTDPPTSSPDAVQYFALAETLGSAVRSATIYRDSERLAHVLRDAVYSASRNMRSITPDSPPRSAPLLTSHTVSEASDVQISTPDLFANLLSNVAPEPSYTSLLPSGEPWWAQSATSASPAKGNPFQSRPPLPHGSSTATQTSVLLPTASTTPHMGADSSLASLQVDDQGLFDFLASCGIGGPFL